MKKCPKKPKRGGWRWLPRLVLFGCEWEQQEWSSGLRHYRLRACKNCRRRQMLFMGPMGDGKWHDEHEWWKSAVGDWEKKNFAKAIRQF